MKEFDDINNVYLGRRLLWPQSNWGQVLFWIFVAVFFKGVKKFLIYLLPQNSFTVILLLALVLLGIQFFLNFMYRKIYLCVDEEKNLIYYSLKNYKADIISVCRFIDMASIKENKFLGKIDLIFVDNSSTTLSDSQDDTPLIIKIKTLLLNNYPDKVPMEWQNDENISRYINERKLPPHSWMQVLKLFTIIVLVLFFIAIFVVAVLFH